MTLIVAGILCAAGRAAAEEAKQAPAAAQTTAAADQAGRVRPIDEDGDDADSGRGETDAGTVLPAYESYDQDTGMPDTVSSDKTGNLE